jgi:hypothetical protein
LTISLIETVFGMQAQVSWQWRIWEFERNLRMNRTRYHQEAYCGVSSWNLKCICKMDLAKCSSKMDCAEWTGSSNVAGFLMNCGNCGWEIQFWVEITFLGSRKVFVEVYWWRYCNAVFGLVLKVKVCVRSFLLCGYIASNRREMQLLHGSCQVTYMIYIHHWDEVKCVVMAPCHSCSWWRWW